MGRLWYRCRGGVTGSLLLGQAEADEAVAEVLGVERPGLVEGQQAVVREEPLAVRPISPGSASRGIDGDAEEG